MHIQKYIEQLGYRRNEVRVYLASLGLGEATISEIAEKAQLPRTSVQTIVGKLHRKNLLNFYLRRRRKYWVAENPEKLLIDFRAKEAALKEIMPQLHALHYDTGVKPTVRFFQGRAGIKQILDDIIETKHNMLSLTSIEDAMQLLGDDFKDFIERRYVRMLRVQFLTNRSPETEELKKRDAEELRQTRFLSDDFKLKNANFIYADKVAIISLNKKMPVGIIVEDGDLAETMTMLFLGFWKMRAE